MVKLIVRRDVRKFALMMLRWIGVAIPATFINSAIRFLVQTMADICTAAEPSLKMAKV
jgi:hypothetical protein